MNVETIRSDALGVEYLKAKHSSGLDIYVMQLKDYKGAFALFGANYGSVDVCFKTAEQEDFLVVPEGIAHFLEHKLFESEDLDAFARFEKTGASANAFTSFDKTCYIFSCSDNFDESLEILLDFVKKPYFTEKTVAKEQGIIGQEIKMYQDSPDWQVVFNLLRALYEKNPVRIDIAGTVESISKITADLLYRCYNTFYNNSNMALVVVGNVTLEQVLSAADRTLEPQAEVKIQRQGFDEPERAHVDYIEEKMSVDSPKFAIGFKQSLDGDFLSARDSVCLKIAMDIIAGKTSELYLRLIEKGLINTAFSSELFSGRGFAVAMLAGESKNPGLVRDMLLEKLLELSEKGVADEDFDISIKKLYGARIRSFNDTDDLAGGIIDCHFSGMNLFSELEAYTEITKRDIEAVICNKFSPDRMSLSVIN